MNHDNKNLSKDTIYDVAIIGAGIVGMSTAMQLQEKYPHLKMIVLEKENEVAKHQTGHNSGVIHSGIYYKPGSLKAKNTQEGIALLHQFCQKHSVPYETCGKLIVATREEELPRLEALMDRGIQNGIKGLRFIEQEEIGKIEPHVRALRAIHIPITGIIDYTEVVRAYQKVFKECGGSVFLNHKVIAIQTIKTNSSQSGRPKDSVIHIETNKKVFKVRFLINCSGLYSDHIARLSGIDPQLQIIPFRGEYYKLNPSKNYLVNNLVYPVPDPEFPFLGVHFTRMIDGTREVGPNAVLAFAREGYTKTGFSLKESLQTTLSLSFWIMSFKYWKMGLKEMFMSYSKPAFVKAVQNMIPAIQSKDLIPAEAGVRAQALEKGGKLVDDFRIISTEHFVHVLNAPSPPATASLAIGKQIVKISEENFKLAASI